MKILLVTPDDPQINAIQEIRTITSLHQVLVLNGKLSTREIYEVAQRGTLDALHFGLHGDDSGLLLGADKLETDDLLQIMRVSGVRLVYFNACNSGALGAFLVARGLPYAIVTNRQLDEADAWKMPLAFYEFLARQERAGVAVDIPLSFGQADSGDGLYSLLVSLPRISTLASVTEKVDRLEGRMRTMFYAMGLLAVVDIVTVSVFVWLLLVLR